MTSYLYLAALLATIGCMALLDHRFRLVLWRDARRAAIVLVIGVAFFLTWDVAAIASGHYRMGAGEAMTGIMVGPELPLEEIVFVTFLCYITLVLRGLAALVIDARGGPGARVGAGAGVRMAGDGSPPGPSGAEAASTGPISHGGTP